MSTDRIALLEKVARWAIAENARGGNGVPKYIAKYAKEAMGDVTPLPKYSSGVRVRYLK